MTNAQKFLAAYRPLLQAAVERDAQKPNPRDRAYALLTTDTPETFAERVSDLMVTHIIRGNDVSVSDSMRRAAKQCGLPNTRRETIFAYVRGKDVAS